MATTAREAIRLAYGNSTNMMTPSVISYGLKVGLAYEISQGEGFEREPIFGVSVVRMDGTKEHELSGCFKSLADAKAYVRAGFRERR